MPSIARWCGPRWRPSRPARRTPISDQALAYLALAERLVKPPPARLIITHGVAGCGKSRASRRLLLGDQAAATLRLRSDVERKRLFGIAPTASSKSAPGNGIYTRNASDLTYQRLHELASELLAAGWSVIVDAAFLERSRREPFARWRDVPEWLSSSSHRRPRRHNCARASRPAGKRSRRVRSDPRSARSGRWRKLEPLCADELGILL
jgi:hypothetical protein